MTLYCDNKEKKVEFNNLTDINKANNLLSYLLKSLNTGRWRWKSKSWICPTSRSIPHSWLIIVTGATQRVSLVEQELLILSEPLSSYPGFKCGSCCLSFFELRILVAPLVCSLFLGQNMYQVLTCLYMLYINRFLINWRRTFTWIIL